MKKLVRRAIVFGLLTSRMGVCAQTAGNSELSELSIRDSVCRVNTLLVDSVTTTVISPTESTKFNAKQLILPGALIAVGTFGVYNGAFKKMNRNIRDEMDKWRGTNYFRADDYIQYLPALTYLTFGSIGVESKHSFKERTVVGITAYAAMTAITNVGKIVFKEKRPDSDSRNSFPSGHTATAFTGAELMREEYGLGLGIGAYAVATGVAFLRIYNGRHWLNDVIAGAGVGILSARIGYWMLPVYRRLFKWNKTPSEIMAVSPGYNHADRSFSINIVCSF